MGNKLNGKRIAILVEEGFEQVELTEPKKALEAEGATAEIVSPQSGSIRGWDKTDWGSSFNVDRTLQQARPEEYDALLLPGGVLNPDKLRTNDQAISFIQSFFENRKPVAAICHGPWTLINAGVANGRTMTSYESIKSDLMNAGVDWVDKEVVVDNGLVTSRKPDDIPAFNKKMVEEFAEGKH